MGLRSLLFGDSSPAEKGDVSGGSHSPFTCEPSKIHTSGSCKDPHVDILHFGADGKKDNDLTKGNSHIADKATVDYARDFHSGSKGKG